MSIWFNKAAIKYYGSKDGKTFKTYGPAGWDQYGNTDFKSNELSKAEQLTMTAHQHLRTSDLDATLKRLMQEVRDNPADPKHRIFLFQLFAVLGQWDRALTQLNVLRDMSQETLSMAQTYQETLNCEALRAQVFAGKRTP